VSELVNYHQYRQSQYQLQCFDKKNHIVVYKKFLRAKLDKNFDSCNYV